MENWIRVDEHYINLDHIVQITTDEKRRNYKGKYIPAGERDGEWYDGGYPYEPCVIFYGPPSTDGNGNVVLSEIMVFGKSRENILSWLHNAVEEEITNLNYADTGWK